MNIACLAEMFEIGGVRAFGLPVLDIWMKSTNFSLYIMHEETYSAKPTPSVTHTHTH